VLSIFNFVKFGYEFASRVLAKWLFIGLLLVPVVAFAVDSEQQVAELEAAIAHQQQEQQILFQQFQMLQELRRHEIAEENQFVPTDNAGDVNNNAAPKYEDMLKRREERIQRIQRYTHELNELYQHYQAAENERRVLIEQLKGLKLDEPAAVK